MFGKNAEYHRNFKLGVINGAAFNTALAFLSGSTVLPVFISNLTDSKITIGIFSTLESFGWFLPQLFAAIFIAHHHKLIKFYNSLSIYRMLFFGLATASVFIFNTDNKILLWSFGICFILFALASGMAGVAFTEIVGRTIPVEKRGSYFGARMFIGGIGAILAGAAVRIIIKEIPLPINFGVIYSGAWIIMLFGLIIFAFVREPEQIRQIEKSDPVSNLRTAFEHFRKDRNFRRLFWSRAGIHSYYMAMPFYVVFAIENLKAAEWMAGTYLTAQMIGYLGTNIFWARLSNNVSNRLVIILAGLATLLPPLFAIVNLIYPMHPMLFGVVFFLIGMAEAGIGMGYISYLLEISPERGRLLSIGLIHTLIAPTVFFSALGGYLAQLFSIQLLFGIVTITVTISLLASLKLSKPKRLKHQGPQAVESI